MGISKSSCNTNVNIGGLKLKNPVITASGTFGYAFEFKDVVNLEKLGGIVVKGLSLKPSTGNPFPRVAETPSGLLNAIGLENVGIDAFVKDKLPFLETLDTPIIANIYGKEIDDYMNLAERVNSIEKISGIEVNISCPNVKAGGVSFGVDPKAAFDVVSKVRKKTDKPLIVKLTPNVTDISQIALSVEDAGADSISLINTITGMVIDTKTRKPMLANITGGLSGPAIKPVALRMVWEVASKVKIPVIGVGGIMTPNDAIEFLIAGATAVQVGTANLINPKSTIKIIKGIEKYLKKNNFSSVTDLTGSIQI